MSIHHDASRALDYDTWLNIGNPADDEARECPDCGDPMADDDDYCATCRKLEDDAADATGPMDETGHRTLTLADRKAREAEDQAAA